MNDSDRVERAIDIRAPRSRVWRAITNAKDFGTWFGLGDELELIGDFVPGARIQGRWVVGGKEMIELFCTVVTVEPERLLAFRWVPYELPEGEDPSKHPTTLIEMRLEEVAGGTRLSVVESGFAKLPPDKQYKRDENGTGWAVQVQSIERHILGHVPVQVGDHIARPPAEVFEAIVDPAKMSRYFISRGSGRMTPRAHLEWEWSDVGAKLDVHVRSVEQDRTISFLWEATGAPTIVTLTLEPEGTGTKLTAVELPFALTEASVARAMGQVQGWTDFCCCLKAYLQHGIDLRRGGRVDHGA